MRRVLFSAAEASGDALGGALLEAMGARGRLLPVGVGGPAMASAGLIPLPGSAPPVGAMGTVEVFGALGATARNAWALRRALENVDAAVLIDAPDLHLPLARAAHARGIPVVGYVSPQVWAWRAGRARAIARDLDLLLCLFDFEPALYAPYGLDARWVGHPAADVAVPSALEPGVVAIVPGSRPAEVRAHLAVFVEAARRAGAREILLPKAPLLPDSLLERLPGDVRVTTRAEVLARAGRALSKSGTSTLELGLAAIPTVVAHRVAWPTWWVGRVAARGLPFVALPNLILGRAVMAEVLQDLDPVRLAALLDAATPPPAEELRTRVRPGSGAASAAAAAVQSFLDR